MFSSVVATQLEKISKLKVLDDSSCETLYSLSRQQDFPQTALAATELLRCFHQAEQNTWWKIEKAASHKFQGATYDSYHLANVNYLPAVQELTEYYLKLWGLYGGSVRRKIYLCTKLLLLSVNVDIALERYAFMEREVIARYTKMAETYLLSLLEKSASYYPELAAQCLRLVSIHSQSIVITPDALLLQEDDQQFVNSIEFGMQALNISHANRDDKIAFTQWLADRKAEKIKVCHKEECVTDFAEYLRAAQEEILAVSIAPEVVPEVAEKPSIVSRLIELFAVFQKTPEEDKQAKGRLAGELALQFEMLNDLKERDHYNKKAFRLGDSIGTWNYFYTLCEASRYRTAMTVVKQYYEKGDMAIREDIVDELKEKFSHAATPIYAAHLVAQTLQVLSPSDMTDDMRISAALIFKLTAVSKTKSSTKHSFFQHVVPSKKSLALSVIAEVEDESNDEQSLNRPSV